jgi:acetolactate synthase-1/3 small subunit
MKREFATLELKVRNHPGVMMHVVGLFARRAFNLEGIACLPCRDRAFSRMWLKVADTDKLPQIMSQLQKLVDVVDVFEHDARHEVFVRMEAFFSDQPPLLPIP